MAAIRFNAVSYASKLKDAGLNAEISDIHAEEINNILLHEIATKDDLNKNLQILEHKMVIKLGAIVVGCTFIISLLIGVLGFLLKMPV